MSDKNIQKVEAVKPDNKSRDDWMRAAYLEAWKQYSHEDTLSVQRNNVFIIIQTAMLATLATISAAMVKLDAISILSRPITIGYALMGLLFIIFGTFSRPFLASWKSATESAFAFAELRRLCAMNIEREVNIACVSLAIKEQEYKNALEEKENPKDFYHPFPHEVQMASNRIPLNRSMGHDTVVELIDCLKRLWRLIFWVGVGLIVLSIVLNIASVCS